MDFKTYQELSRQTAIYPRLGNNLEYPMLGLVDELGELCEAVGDENIAKEMGDVYWYLAQLATEFGFSLQQLNDELFTSTVLLDRNLLVHTDKAFKFQAFIYASKLAGRVKKIQRDYDGKCPELMIPVIREYMKGILTTLGKIPYELSTYDYNSVLQLNIDKLFDRKERNVLNGEGDSR